VNFDDTILDNSLALAAGDPEGMLQAIATSGAQVRRSLLWVSENSELFSALATDGRPRALIVCGIGGSAVAGDIVRAATIGQSPIPVLSHRGYSLPAWIGALDVVIAISCSGETEEALTNFDEAVRRGCRVVAIGATGSALAKRAEQAKTHFVAIDAGGRPPRANLWSLTIPVLKIADAVGVASFPTSSLESIADALDEEAQVSGPHSDFDQNPAKTLAYSLAGKLPVAWGSTPLGGVAAYRFAAQCAENADYPCLHGELPEPNHNQVVMFDGVLGAKLSSDDDVFSDRLSGQSADLALSLFLLRDLDEYDKNRRRAQICVDLATERGISVQEIRIDAEHALARFAALVARIDFATSYLGLGFGINPSDISPIMALKDRMSK